MNEDRSHVAIFEDAIRSKNNPHIHLKDVEQHFVDNQVYYLLYQRHTLDQIYHVLRKADSVWHSLVVLAKTKQLPIQLNEHELLKICENSKHITTTCHDSENCVSWSAGSRIRN